MNNFLTIYIFIAYVILYFLISFAFILEGAFLPTDTHLSSSSSAEITGLQNTSIFLLCFCI